MFLVGPLALAAAPAIISGIAGFFGGRQTNKVNQREADKNRAFQAGQATDQMAFQERMRNTEWQAGVNDMLAAGINPAVAYARGGASAPGGAAGGGAQAAPAVDAVGAGVSSAMAANAQRKQIEMMTQQVEGQKAANVKAFAEGQIGMNDLRMSEAKTRYYFDMSGRPLPPLKALLDAEFNQTQASSARSVSDAQLAQFSVPEQQAIARLFETVGTGGKGMQMLLPLLNTLIARRR